MRILIQDLIQHQSSISTVVCLDVDTVTEPFVTMCKDLTGTGFKLHTFFCTCVNLLAI